MNSIGELFLTLPEHIANNVVVDDAEPLDYECIKALGRYGYNVFYKPNSGVSDDRANTRPASEAERRRLPLLGQFRVQPDYVGGRCHCAVSGGANCTVSDAIVAVTKIWDDTARLRR